jgi:hypothetical protein
MGRIMPKRILSVFRNLFRQSAVELALDDELRSTLEALTQEKTAQLPLTAYLDAMNRSFLPTALLLP